jgi:hypothetical protein
MNFSCYHCNTNTKLDVKIEVLYFSCPNCATIYTRNESNDFVFKERKKKIDYNNTFSVGQKAEFDGEVYSIIGFLVKSSNHNIRWIEYVLQNDNEDFLYLSESSGNFILLEQIEFEKKVGNHPLTVNYLDNTFDRFDYSYPTLDYAAGFFDFNILNKIELIEYINPPFILSFEKFGKEQTAFYGKHISRRAIKNAFNTSILPPKLEIGMVEPFFFKVRNLVLTFCVIGFLIIFTHWYLNQDRVEKEVLNTSIPFSNFTSQDFVSPTFELKGSSAPLQISVSSNVDNSWANVQIALVNENTNEEIYASKDIEYYHGYTDGENWSEGSTSEDFNICGVGAGKYHLTITPSKAPEDFANSLISIKANWNAPSNRNIYMVFLFMTIFAVGVHYWSKYFENKRWGEY